MNDNERIQKEKSLAENWEQIAKGKDQLDKLITPCDIDSLDVILLYLCLQVVLQHLEVHEEEIVKTPDIEVKDINSFLDYFMEGMGNFLRMNDKKISYSERLEAANNMKKCAWKTLYNDIENITKLYKQPLTIIDSNNMELMLKCVYIVLFELGIRELELSILEDMYNI